MKSQTRRHWGFCDLVVGLQRNKLCSTVSSKNIVNLVSNQTRHYAQTPNAAAVIFRNGEELKLQITPQEFLNQYDTAVYSAARTVGTKSVFDWESHIGRLAMITQEKPFKNNHTESKNIDVKIIDALVRPNLKQAMNTFLTRYPERSKEELKLFLLATPKANASAQTNIQDAIDVLSYVMPLPIKKERMVTVRGRCVPQRVSPQLKDSTWLRTRKQWENEMEKDEEEVMMYDAQGEVHEGLSSNVFVVQEGTILTAPDDIVLKGTIRGLVLEQCEKHKVPLKLECPFVSNRSKWQSMFITSTTRVVKEVGLLRLPDEPKIGDRMECKEFRENPLIAEISSWVFNAMQEKATEII